MKIFGFGVFRGSTAQIMTSFRWRISSCRSYWKALDIRLSGPPLGKKRVGEAGAKESCQMRNDACERNGIESSNGVAKRKYGLDLIMSKLDETAKTEAALVILAMSAAHWLRRWLCAFSPFGGWMLFFSKP